jgi:hypothetical protein
MPVLALDATGQASLKIIQYRAQGVPCRGGCSRASA